MMAQVFSHAGGGFVSRDVMGITGACIHFGSSRLVCVWFAVSIKMPYLATRRITPGWMAID